MASQSLYRKWRSQSFADLVGQEPVVQTLCHAVRDGRLAHAYLFCGPRGTGKTSAARLLAKAINCARPHDGEPCNDCLSCREIAEGRSPDVIEIDAASNNSVENMRDLRGNVNILSTGGRSKVYIIDEVHMLSAQAFNALLKTLEEPPPHVVFVLATTEAHKVLPTIASRCQRLNFRRHSYRTIVARLQHVAQGEGLRLDPAAADLLARAAQGGMRDALSLLDQAMAFCGTEIRLEAVRTMLGLADGGAVRALVEHVVAGRSAEGLYLINELVESGADLRQLNSQLAELWRALVLARAGADVARIMDCSQEEAEELAAVASQFALDELTACARIFAANDTPARGLPVPQLGLELSYLECLAVRRRGAPAALSARPIASAAGTGTAPGGATTAVPVPAAAPPTAPGGSVASAAAAPEPSPTPVVAELDGPPVWQRPPALNTPPPADSSASERSHARDQALATAPEPQPDGETLFAVDQDADAGAPAEAAAPGEAGDEWLRRAVEHWELIKKVCRQKRRTVAALLHSARPIAVEAGNPLEVVLQADYQFHLDKLREPTSRADVEWALEQVLERPCHVRLVLAGSSALDGPSGSGSQRAPGAPGSATNGDGAAWAPAEEGRTTSRGGAELAGPSGPQGSANGAHASFSAGSAVAGTITPLNGNGRGRAATEHAAERGASNAVRGAARAYSQRARDAGTAPSSQRDDQGASPGDGDAARRALEAAALADPVVQEIIRTFPAELVEVYPLPPETDP